MPELPEVETVCTGLRPIMKGARIARLVINRPNLRFPFPGHFERRLVEARILDLSRRAKFLRADLSTGESLLMHLGMSGRFIAQPVAKEMFHRNIAHNTIHDHVVFYLDTGGDRHCIVYNDPRRFGFMDLVTTERIALSRYFIHLGPEPLGKAFTAHYLEGALRGKHLSIKQALLDQRLVAGLGNIYVCEALFRAGISPRRKARSVIGVRAARLVPAIRKVLQEAIIAGGSSLRDFKDVRGDLGYFQHRFDVYGRDGQLCQLCNRQIMRIVQAGRSTFFCSGCQR